ncbi:hypothetical protein RHSIM_Rhsim07G0185700 [Rhododendron simsii]|uniref:Uncharacterized protein n=1 Tax=Rhododendron simsii TaxID=118357 RepID=A0A834GTY8_RHOSS|nr:hypothetical protein RHSIM_Rhsim07G0185700 [Rhododendron simsii]
MACVISFIIPMHLPASQTLDKEMRPRSALGRLSRQATSRTAIALVAPQCMSLVNRSCNCQKMNISGHVCGSGSHPFNVSSSSPAVISGFWVGPDIEDGWGFVEAFINQIF